MADPATTRLANTVGYVYEDNDSYTRFEDEEGRDMVTDAYDASKTYAEGALCINDNKLYKAASAIETAEVWTPDHWTQTDINTELSSLNTNLQSLISKLGKCYSCSGDYTIVQWNLPKVYPSIVLPYKGTYFGIINFFKLSSLPSKYLQLSMRSVESNGITFQYDKHYTVMDYTTTYVNVGISCIFSTSRDNITVYPYIHSADAGTTLTASMAATYIGNAN